jgi:hypothetical protein
LIRGSAVLAVHVAPPGDLHLNLPKPDLVDRIVRLYIQVIIFDFAFHRYLPFLKVEKRAGREEDASLPARAPR